jgi:DNA-binding response OmpR family regulator
MEPSAVPQPAIRARDEREANRGRRRTQTGPRQPRRTSKPRPSFAGIRTEGLAAETPALAALRVAVVDGDSGFLLVLAKRLDRLGWSHRLIAPTVPIETIASMPLDALVLDPAILGPRCWDWFQRLCQARPTFRILICTSSSTVAERVRALEMGADDWLSKPCHSEELVARIEAAVGRRRRSEPRDTERFMIGEVEICPDQYQAFVDNESLDLTRREYELIELFASADNEVFDRELIYRTLWHRTMLRNDRSVDVFVHKLRRKLEQASPGWRYIHTHWGLGYRFAPQLIDGSEAVPAELEAELEAALAA